MALSNLRNFIIDSNGTKLSDAFSQVKGAIKDLNRNYWDMRRDNTIGNDDYFHCKGNFEATQRGVYGKEVARAFGNEKEWFDFYYNQLVKGLTKQEAIEDYNHDTFINKLGRQQAESGLYSNSKEGCDILRVNSINEKY